MSQAQGVTTPHTTTKEKSTMTTIIAKVMSTELLVDSDPSKCYELFVVPAGKTVSFERVSKDRANMIFQDVVEHPDSSRTLIPVEGTVYLMEGGKTISTFSPRQRTTTGTGVGDIALEIYRNEYQKTANKTSDEQPWKLDDITTPYEYSCEFSEVEWKLIRLFHRTTQQRLTDDELEVIRVVASELPPQQIVNHSFPEPKNVRNGFIGVLEDAALMFGKSLQLLWEYGVHGRGLTGIRKQPASPMYTSNVQLSCRLAEIENKTTGLVSNMIQQLQRAWRMGARQIWLEKSVDVSNDTVDEITTAFLQSVNVQLSFIPGTLLSHLDNSTSVTSILLIKV